MAGKDSTAVAKVEEQNTALVENDFFDGAGTGHEDFDNRDFTIPYIGILQALSKPLQKGHAKYIKGAEQGMLINSATQQLYKAADDEEGAGVIVVPCYFHHRYVAWKPNNGGIAHDYGTESLIFDGIEPNERGQRFDPEGNEVIDTMEYFILIVNPETGEFEPAVLPFSKSYSKKAKKWNNIIRMKSETHDGKLVRPAIYFYAYKLTTVPESNDKGSWYSHQIVDYAKVPTLPNGKGIFQAAKELRESVVSGAVRAAVEEPHTGEENDDGKGAF